MKRSRKGRVEVHEEREQEDEGEQAVVVSRVGIGIGMPPSPARRDRIATIFFQPKGAICRGITTILNV